MKLGKQEGCLFDDRIDVEFSPDQLRQLIELVLKESLSENNYTMVGYWRILTDLLQQRYDEWRKLRDEKDKEAKEPPCPKKP